MVLHCKPSSQSRRPPNEGGQIFDDHHEEKCELGFPVGQQREGCPHWPSREKVPALTPRQEEGAIAAAQKILSVTILLGAPEWIRA